MKSAKLNNPLSAGQIHILLAVLFLLTLFLRYWYGFYASIISRDGIEYVKVMNYWEQNGKLPMVWYTSAVPFFFFRLGALVVGDIASGILWCNILFSALTVFPLYRLCRIFDLDREISLAAVLLFAVSTSFTETGASYLREPAGLFFVTSGFCCMAQAAKKDSVPWWAAAGAVFTCAAFCRIEFLEMNLVILIYSILLLWFKKIKFSRLCLWAAGYIGGVLAVFVLVMLIIKPSAEEVKTFYDLIIFRFRVNTNSNYIGKPQDVPEYYFFH